MCARKSTRPYLPGPAPSWCSTQLRLGFLFCSCMKKPATPNGTRVFGLMGNRWSPRQESRNRVFTGPLKDSGGKLWGLQSRAWQARARAGSAGPRCAQLGSSRLRVSRPRARASTRTTVRRKKSPLPRRVSGQGLVSRPTLETAITAMGTRRGTRCARNPADQSLGRRVAELVHPPLDNERRILRVGFGRHWLRELRRQRRDPRADLGC